MPLFSIGCETCGASLAVHNAEAIGNILACPKCEGMVMIQAPADWSAVPEKIDSTSAESGASALAEESTTDLRPALQADTATTVVAKSESNGSPTTFEPTDSTSADSAPPALPPQRSDMFSAQPPVRSKVFDHDAPTADAQKAIDPEEIKRDEEIAAAVTAQPPVLPDDGTAEDIDSPETSQPTPALSSAPPAPPKPGEDWSPSTAPVWRQIALLVGAAIFGIGSAIGIFLLVIGGLSEPPPNDLANNEPKQVGTSEGLDSGDAPIDPAQPETDIGEADTDDTTDDPNDPASETPNVPVPVEPTTTDPQPPVPVDPTDPLSPDPVTPDPLTPDPVTPDPLTPDPVTPDPLTPDPLTPDPLSPDPKSLDDGGIDDVLARFAPYLDPGLIESGALPSARDDDPAEKIDAPTGADIVEEKMPRPEPLNVNVAERLADPLASIEFKETRLADFLAFISDLSTIPITVDPLALQLGVSLDDTVNVTLTDTTVGEALTAALKAKSLAFQKQEQGLLISYPSLASPGPQTKKHPISDLASSADEVDQLAKVIRLLISPNSWGEPGAAMITLPGELEITQPMSSQARIASLMKRLRVARTDVDSSRLKLPVEQAAAGLQKRVTLNYLQPTLFTAVLKRLEKESGLRFTVDWLAVAEEGWNPRGEVTLTVDKEMAQTALEKLLTEMNLGYRLLGGGVIEITSLERAATLHEVQFHPLTGLVGGPAMHEVFLKRVRNSLGAGLFAAGNGALHIDAKSNYLLANLSQADQQRLAELLATMRVAP